VAAVNGPDLQVISGPLTALAEVARACESRGVETQPLAVSHAFHSHLMTPILTTFTDLASRFVHRPLERPLVSNLDGRIRAAGTQLDASYWRDHMLSAVQFNAGMRSLAEEGCTAFLEIGPATTLLGMGRRCIDLDNAVWLPSLKKTVDTLRVVLESLATLYTIGFSVDWEAFDGDSGWRRIRLSDA